MGIGSTPGFTAGGGASVPGGVGRSRSAEKMQPSESTQTLSPREAVDDVGERIENEAGLYLSGPPYFRGDEEIRDRALFSLEALEALSSNTPASQGSIQDGT